MAINEYPLDSVLRARQAPQLYPIGPVKKEDDIDKTIGQVLKVLDASERLITNPLVATILKKRFGFDTEKVLKQDVSEAAGIAAGLDAQIKERELKYAATIPEAKTRKT